MRFVVVMTALAVSACHSSCSEETGAQPVVTEEAGPVLGAQHATPNVRPGMRPIRALNNNNQSTSATPPPPDEN